MTPAEQLLDVIGQMEDCFVQEAAQPAAAVSVLEMRRKKRKRMMVSIAAAAAAVVILLPNMSMSVARAWEKLPVLSAIVKVVVWRDYKVQEGGHEADISVPQVKIEAGEAANAAVNEQLQQSAEEINASVEELTARIITEFESALAEDADMQGVDAVSVGHEVVTDTERYFSLKVWSLEVMGSGYEQDFYYTIDRKTGKLLTLADLFSGSAYVQAISGEIQRQMRAQMAADETVCYWVDDPEVAAWEFQQISDAQSFYITEEGRLVICFNEGDVAPMSMGCVTFEMPETIWSVQN